MSDPTRDYVSWLRARRATVLAAATDLAERAARQGRTFSPAEHAQYDALDDALTALDNRLRAAWVAHRADPGYRPSVNTWARDNRGGSFAAAPLSGDRSTFATLRNQ